MCHDHIYNLPTVTVMRNTYRSVSTQHMFSAHFKNLVWKHGHQAVVGIGSKQGVTEDAG